MKMIKLIFLGSVVLQFLSCAPASQNTEVSTPAPETIASSGYVLSGTTKVAFVLDIQDNYAQIYIPTVDKYSEVSVTTGVYHSYARIYHAGIGCAGEKRAVTFFGTAGKAVIFDGFAYYNVGAAVTGSFNYQSTSGGGNCSAETSARPETYSVSVGTMPYDFTALAPLNIQFQ